MGQAFHPFPGEGGVADANAIDTVLDERFCHGLQFFRAIVRRDLDHQRYLAAVLLIEAVLGLAQGGQQGIERITMLELPQPRRVWGGNVHHQVGRIGVYFLLADQVIIHSAFHRGVLVLANVDAQHTLVVTAFHCIHQVIHPLVVEAHAIDDSAGFRQAEKTRFGVTRLCTRGDGADLDETEAQIRQSINTVAILVQPGSQPHRIGKLDAHHLHRRRHLTGRPELAKALAQQCQRQIMGLLGREGEQQGSGKGIQHGGIRNW